MLKKILTTSEYLHIGTYIPQKNDRDGDPRDIFQGGGRQGVALYRYFGYQIVKVRRGVLTKFFKFLDLKVSTGRWMGLHWFIYRVKMLIKYLN